MRYPFDGTYPVNSPFGPRAGGFHPGVDFGTPVGTPMIACADGAVIFASDEGATMGGNHVAVLMESPPDPTATKYGYMHLSRVDVSVGQRVREGDVVGLSGGIRGAPGSGNSQGPHLHFWIGTNANTGAVDPLPYLDASEDDLPLNDDDKKWIQETIAVGVTQAANQVLRVLVGRETDTTDRDLIGIYEQETRKQIIDALS